ncbi:MAG: SIS domain-containing protein [Candidatus Nanoarchaeia archaeon]|nr:SIS domain-containing protein [Candidatus Nanoarchaeia archaeon]
MEIAELKKILNSQDKKIRASTEDEASLKKMAGMLKEAKNVILSGEGDKFIIPMISKYLSDAYSDKKLEVYNARVLANYTPESINQDSLVFFLTVRGKNIDIIDAINEIKSKNASIIVITQLENKIKDSIYSALKGYKKYEIFIPIKDEIITTPSITTSNTFLSVLNTIIIYSLEDKINIEPLLITQLVDLPVSFSELNKSSSFHEWCIESAKKIKSLANPMLFFIGDGPRYPICKKASQIQFLEQCKLIGTSIQSEEFINLILEEYLNKDFNQMWILLKPVENFISVQAMNRFNEMHLMISERFEKDRIIIIDPAEFINLRGTGKKNDIILSQIYILIIEWLSYYCML